MIPAKAARQLQPKHLEWLQLYLGRDDRYRGNKTRAYMKAYECDDPKVAQTSGWRLSRRPEIMAIIEHVEQKALDNLGVDATFVLQESLRVYDRAMGHEAVEVDVVDRKTGLVRSVEQRSVDLAIANKALEMIGRHTSVQAFQDNVEHSHTHRLEQALARRHNELEARAARRPANIEGKAVIVENDAGPATDHDPARPAPESQKRVHQGGGHAESTPAPAKTAPERAGAQGE